MKNPIIEILRRAYTHVLSEILQSLLLLQNDGYIGVIKAIHRIALN